MYCYNCGKQMDDDNQFCPFCGAEQNFDDVEVENNDKRQAMNILLKKPKVTIIVLACIIVLCLAGIGFYILFLGSSTTNGRITADKVSVLDYDMDWDSSYFDETYDAYKVDVIMLVKNDRNKDIKRLSFAIKDKDGESIPNAMDLEEPFSTYGIVEGKTTGVMVGEIWLKEKRKATSDIALDLLNLWEYKDKEKYAVPKGKIVAAKGINKDYYSVEIANPNGVEISKTATFVAVKIVENDIKDADATGRIEEPIPAGSKATTIDNVFQDPGFRNSFKEYIVYAIDEANYR